MLRPRVTLRITCIDLCIRILCVGLGLEGRAWDLGKGTRGFVSGQSRGSRVRRRSVAWRFYHVANAWIYVYFIHLCVLYTYIIYIVDSLE